jgi:zinc transporter 13
MNVKESTKSKKIDITGYLNLLANGFDNLTHGLAVGASFLVSFKMGLLTTFAIVIHEIPHEIGDFAILIKSGFSKWEAVKAQVSIASVTVLGSILPFTSGGFLHIALVSILPELLNEPNLHQSLKQAFFIASGITVMAFVNLIAE